MIGSDRSSIQQRPKSHKPPTPSPSSQRTIDGAVPCQDVGLERRLGVLVVHEVRGGARVEPMDGHVGRAGRVRVLACAVRHVGGPDRLGTPVPLADRPVSGGCVGWYNRVGWSVGRRSAPPVGVTRTQTHIPQTDIRLQTTRNTQRTWSRVGRSARGASPGCWRRSPPASACGAPSGPPGWARRPSPPAPGRGPGSAPPGSAGSCPPVVVIIVMCVRGSGLGWGWSVVVSWPWPYGCAPPRLALRLLLRPRRRPRRRLLARDANNGTRTTTPASHAFIHRTQPPATGPPRCFRSQPSEAKRAPFPMQARRPC